MSEQQRPLEEITANIKELMGVTDDDPRRGAHLNICNAQHHASNCAGCAKKLKPDEPVWRPRVLNPWGNRWTAPVCKKCKGDRHRFDKPKPCGGCGRPVHNMHSYDSWRRKLTFCCDDCRSKAASKMARELRTKDRGTHECDECGETFDPTRTDSKFCSGACRQKAYRNRVTDNAMAPRHRRKSRNAAKAVQP